VPLISAIVPAYNSRDKIDIALRSLRAQDLSEPFQVIVVDSGSDGCADYVAGSYPEVRVVRSQRRLLPGAACNAGARVAQGQYLAFLPDDCAAHPEWLRRRAEKHREGFGAVGGSVTNGTASHPVGTAGYFVEYTAQLPSESVLARQAIPHSLSYERELFQRLGGFPEDLANGEDTVMAIRCIQAGVAIGFDPRAAIAHRNLTRVRDHLRHQYDHGRGLARCLSSYPSHELGASAPQEERALTAAAVILVRDPTERWLRALARVVRGQPRSLPAFLLLTPLIWAGIWAAAAGRWVEWRALRAAASTAPVSA
jgi:glycosyltransferase involved in cell wall biosynthesis